MWVQQTNPDLLILTQTWLTDQIKDDVALNGYNCISSGHLFENPNTSAIVEDGCTCNHNRPFEESLSLREFSVKEVSDALASIDHKTKS